MVNALECVPYFGLTELLEAVEDVSAGFAAGVLGVLSEAEPPLLGTVDFRA